MKSGLRGSVNARECEAAGLDAKEVDRIARGLSRYAQQAEKLGLKVFGGSGTGTLRTDTSAREGSLIVANLEGLFDGGDGGSSQDEDGLLRGEF